MPHRHMNGSADHRRSSHRAPKRSALRASALQRLAIVAAPIAVLWGAVALALDLFA